MFVYLQNFFFVCSKINHSEVATNKKYIILLPGKVMIEYERVTEFSVIVLESTKGPLTLIPTKAR